jgi:hypothetical protein
MGWMHEIILHKFKCTVKFVCGLQISVSCHLSSVLYRNMRLGIGHNMLIPCVIPHGKENQLDDLWNGVQFLPG